MCLWKCAASFSLSNMTSSDSHIFRVSYSAELRCDFIKSNQEKFISFYRYAIEHDSNKTFFSFRYSPFLWKREAPRRGGRKASDGWDKNINFGFCASPQVTVIHATSAEVPAEIARATLPNSSSEVDVRRRLSDRHLLTSYLVFNLKKEKKSNQQRREITQKSFEHAHSTGAIKIYLLARESRTFCQKKNLKIGFFFRGFSVIPPAIESDSCVVSRFEVQFSIKKKSEQNSRRRRTTESGSW